MTSGFTWPRVSRVYQLESENGAKDFVIGNDRWVLRVAAQKIVINDRERLCAEERRAPARVSGVQSEHAVHKLLLDAEGETICSLKYRGAYFALQTHT